MQMCRYENGQMNTASGPDTKKMSHLPTGGWLIFWEELRTKNFELGVPFCGLIFYLIKIE
jgi:hypothetical protein